MTTMRRLAASGLARLACVVPAAGHAQQDSLVLARNDSVMVRLVDVELRTAVQALARYLDRPLVIGNVTGGRVTLETPQLIPRAGVLQLLRGLLESQNIDLVVDSAANLYTLRPRDAQRLQPGIPPPQMAPGGPPQLLELFVIRLRHARAAEVAATVNALYGKSSALGDLGAQETPGAAPTLANELRQNVVPPAGTPPQAVPSVAGRSASLAGDVTIIPDRGTNTLLIRASRADFALIRAAVTELDVRPLQALIEVIIAEVRKDRGFSIGTDWKLLPVNVKETDLTVSGSSAGLGLGDMVVRVLNIGKVNAEATLRAAADRGDATIVSRPVVVAANNEVAEINVGSQRPFIQVQRSLPTDSPQRDQVVQYKDVGTKLSVRPTISADGYVQLEVTQEANAATNETAFDAPVISTRSVSTHLVLKDGQTIVLGGISDRQKEKTSGGIPVLSRIPLLGALFGRQTRRSTETELFLFLTPTVLYGDEDVERESETYRKRSDKVVPLPRDKP